MGCYGLKRLTHPPTESMSWSYAHWVEQDTMLPRGVARGQRAKNMEPHNLK